MQNVDQFVQAPVCQLRETLWRIEVSVNYANGNTFIHFNKISHKP